MAEIYAKVGGKKLTKIIAQTEEAQRGLDKETRQVALAAETRLAQHRHEGHAEISVEVGKIDRYVILSDERGQAAANVIEFGRPGDENGKGAMKGLGILSKAAGIRTPWDD